MHEIDLGQWFHRNGLRQGLEIRLRVLAFKGCYCWGTVSIRVDRLTEAAKILHLTSGTLK